MSTKSYLTCTEASQLMGVSRSTVQRYCDQGVLKLHRTVGGHRRLKSDDVVAWTKSRKAARRRPRSKPFSEDKYTPDYVADALLAGRPRRLEPLVDEVLGGRKERAWLFDHCIAPAMWEVGHRWQQGRISYAEERCATSNLKLLFRMLSTACPPTAGRTTAVGGALEGDYAEIGSLMVEAVFQENDHSAFHIGSNIPVQSMVDVAWQLDADFVWITYCHIEDERRAIQQNHELHEKVDDHVVVAVGGGALTPSLREQMRFDFHSHSMTELNGFLAGQPAAEV